MFIKRTTVTVMASRQARRIERDLTPEESQRVEQQRAQIAAELPDLACRDKLRREAREENTFSGELRRAIHNANLSITQIADRIAVTPLVLDEFLTGERTLRSDVIERLIDV